MFGTNILPSIKRVKPQEVFYVLGEAVLREQILSVRLFSTHAAAPSVQT